MDSQPIDRVSKAFATWISRRKVVKIIAAMAAGGAIAQGKTRAQGDTSLEPAAEVPAQSMPMNSQARAIQSTEAYEPAPAETTLPTEPPPPTEPPLPTETMPPTETPLPTETPTPTVEATPTPTEALEQVPREQPPPTDDLRTRIADLCQQAADVLAEDVAEPSAFDNHPHPDGAFGFLRTLNAIALWGVNAQSWDDAMVANYVEAADSIGYAIRIGADAYYEVSMAGLPQGVFPEDPDTCIFRELAKWRDCIASCAEDDALCRLTCFWDFTVLQSCRRCLRSF
jgi:hypothetical protein